MLLFISDSHMPIYLIVQDIKKMYKGSLYL